MRFPGGRIIEEVLNEVSKHVGIIKQGVERLQEMIGKYNTLAYHELEALYGDLSLLENKGDELKIAIMNTLRASHIHPDDREDLLRLVLDVDDIIGVARAVAKKLLIFKHLDIRIPSSVYDYIKEMIDHSVQAVHNVEEMINAKTQDQVFEIASRVEKFEKEVDEIRLRALEALYKHCLSQCNVACIALPIVIDDVELITDLCEDIADIYRLYIISR